MALLSKEAREKAIKTTNDFITNLTFEEAQKICEPVETVVENVKEYVYQMGVGGIYYSPEKNNIFCHEMITKAIYFTYLGGLAKQSKEKKPPRFMPRIDLNNEIHRDILTKLVINYYTDGDYKEVYDNRELLSSMLTHFDVVTDDDVVEFLTEVDPYNRYQLTVELNPEY